LRVEIANGTPNLVTLCVEKNKSRREFKTIYGRKLHTDTFLYVQADKVDLFADAGLAIKFLFKLVNGGLNLGACNSEGGLKFKQDGRTCADDCLHRFGIVHERSLAGMQNHPGHDESDDNNSKGEVVVQFWLVRKQHKAGGDDQQKGN
jgi:hypothetical protein